MCLSFVSNPNISSLVAEIPARAVFTATVSVSICACECPQKPEGDIRCSGTEVPYSGESPYVGAGNPTLVLYKTKMFS